MYQYLPFLLIFTIVQIPLRSVLCQDDLFTMDENNLEDLSGFPSHLFVTSWNDMPFSGIVMTNGSWIGRGYAFYLFDLLSAKLNFTYTVIPPKEHVLGGERTGILGLLHQKKVDVAVAFLPALPEMRRFCSFSTALDETRLTALMKRPQESATGSGLLAPFHRTVWLLVLAAVLFFGPVIYIFALLRSRLWHNPESENFSLPSCAWFVYSSLLKQGTNIMAETDSTRMLFATWWIFILILTSFYTANLTAFLTKPQFTLSINSLSDIVKGGYSWVTYKGRTVDFLLSQPEINELTILNTTTARAKGKFKYNEPSKAILNSVSTKKLFLAEAHYLQTLIFEDYLNKTRKQLEHSLRCTYVIMPGNILVSDRAFAFPHNSTIEETINRELLKLVETGIIKHTKEKGLPLAEICPVDLRSSERRLRNTDLLLTYKVIGAGYTLAAVVFIIEFAISWESKRKKHRRLKDSQQDDTKNSKWFQINETKDLSLDKTDYFQRHVSDRHHNDDESRQRKRQFVNGRDYYIVIGNDGDQRLIPIRTPSAFLFQYAT